MPPDPVLPCRRLWLIFRVSALPQLAGRYGDLDSGPRQQTAVVPGVEVAEVRVVGEIFPQAVNVVAPALERPTRAGRESSRQGDPLAQPCCLTQL
jgi:hypothetical protein